ncbi:MAG TPA: glycoside hydrolase family 15 protein [Longimicrobiales bacterium]|nr:glycoside hydrolase family 15 protein [Longimicrobiales bacterium]
MRWIRDSVYKPISRYGVIGDTRTAALIGADGAIDWCCFPRFDSPSVFGAILDNEKGGRFRVCPVGDYTSTQRYFPLTNILVTSFHLHDGSGAFEVLDVMPSPDGHIPLAAPHEINRRVRGLHGRARVEVTFEPRFDYARAATHVQACNGGVLASGGSETLSLTSPDALDWSVDDAAGSASAEFEVHPGVDRWLVLRWNVEGVRAVEAADCQRKLEATASYWNEWAGNLRCAGLYRAEVERSALALKLLFYEPTGAVVAAPTTALPEEIGGVRNWDYRYCWLRDAAFTLSAFNIVGLHDEARRFVQYLHWVAGKSDGPLQIMYGIGGEMELDEHELTHLSGYRDSRPVRIGNGAHSQLQLDIYGELLAAVSLWHEQHLVDEEFWQLLITIVDWVADNWQRPDSSIWEIRAEPRHYVYSKVMCWVALDRAIHMAGELGAPPRLEHWRAQRAAIHEQVLERGWDEERGTFVQSYGSSALDAANLLIGVYGFLPGDDPRMKGTIAATLRELTRDGMLYRYTSEDGLPGQEGVFSICTFWLADALVLSGDVEAGERVFRRMLRFANPLGLYSEQIDPRTGDFLGNFPQAFTHIALINTARLLERG